MFAGLRSAVSADIDRQIGWAKDQLKRQTRHTALTGILACVAALAALGAVIVGLIALHSWFSTRTGPFVAHGLIGGGLLLLGAYFVRAGLDPAASPASCAAAAADRAARGSARGTETRQLRQSRNGRRADVETGDRNAP
jgi:hypothetical protein